MQHPKIYTVVVHNKLFFDGHGGTLNQRLSKDPTHTRVVGMERMKLWTNDRLRH